MLRVTSAMLRNDLPWLRGWIAGTFDADISEGTLAGWLRMLTFGKPCLPSSVKDDDLVKAGSGWRIYTVGDGQKMLVQDYSDDDWRLWFANRLREIGAWPPAPGNGSGLKSRLTVDLHMFFVHLEESDEMLARLRTPDKSERTPAGPSTPGIERTEVVLEPIDRTARRVISSEED